MYSEDLSPLNYQLEFHPFSIDDVLAVGWLDSAHDYNTGLAPRGLVDHLLTLSGHSTSTFDIHANIMRGIHPCNFCGEDIVERSDGKKQWFLGHSELWFPSATKYFAAPSLIIHYIADHQYLPPDVFVQAVFALNINDSFLAQEVSDRFTQIAMSNIRESQRLARGKR
jgi:hypothetical protein